MFHIVGFSRTAAGAETDADATFAADEVLTIRNSHLITDDELAILTWFLLGAQVTRGRLSNVSNTIRGFPYIWPLNAAATVNSPPSVPDLMRNPIIIPRQEELTVAVTQGAAGTGQGLLWVAPRSFNPAIPTRGERLITRATATIVAATEATWSALATLTFTRDLQGGVYSVIGAYLVAANAVGFRLYFPTGPLWNGRRMRPGGLVQNAVNSIPCRLNSGILGEWGRFWTFEPPQLQVFGDAAGGTYELMLDLAYLGTDRGLLGTT